MHEWIIVDGNNLIHSDEEGLFGDHRTDFESARWGLARQLDELVGELADKMTVVFDGTVGGKDEAFQTTELQVVFSPVESTADSLIETMVTQSQDPGQILVVSSDRGERDTVVAAGARSMSCRHFIELIKETRETLQRRLNRRNQQRTPRPVLGDFFPKDC
jgi:predicted RNA-binding protein with PIN domain